MARGAIPIDSRDGIRIMLCALKAQKRAGLAFAVFATRQGELRRISTETATYRRWLNDPDYELVGVYDKRAKPAHILEDVEEVGVRLP